MVDPTWTEPCPVCGYAASRNQLGQFYGHQARTGCPFKGSQTSEESLVRRGMFPLKFSTRAAITAALAYKDDRPAATIRYAWEHASRIEAGDHLSLRDTDGDSFGVGEVVDVHSDVNVRDAVLAVWESDALYSMESGKKLVDALNSYYEPEITYESEVIAIEYEPAIVGWG